MRKIGIYPGYRYRSTSFFEKLLLLVSTGLFGYGGFMLYYKDFRILGVAFAVVGLFYFFRFVFTTIHPIAKLKKGWCYYKIDEFTIAFKLAFFWPSSQIRWDKIRAIEFRNRRVMFFLSRSKKKTIHLWHLSYKRYIAIKDAIKLVAKEKGIEIDYLD